MSDAAAAKKKNDDIDLPAVAKVGEAPAASANASAGGAAAPPPKRLKRKPYSIKRTHDIIMEGACAMVLRGA